MAAAAAAIMIEIIAMASNLSVSRHDYSHYHYLPICTGTQTPFSNISVNGGELIVLGYNHLGQGATIYTLNRTRPPAGTDSSDASPDTTTNGSDDSYKTWWERLSGRKRRQAQFGSSTIQSRDHVSALQQLHYRARILNTRFKLWRRRRLRSPILQLDRDGQRDFKRQGKRQFWPHPDRWHRPKFRNRLLTHVAPESKKGQDLRKTFQDSAQPTTSAQKSPSAPSTSHPVDQTRSLSKVHRSLRSILEAPTKQETNEQASGVGPNSSTPDRIKYRDQASSLVAAQLNAPGLGDSPIQADDRSLVDVAGRSSCNCEINAVSDFTVKFIDPKDTPDRTDQHAAVWVMAGHVSKHLPVFQKGEQIRVYRKAREARTPVSREGSSVDGERYTTYGQSTNVINAKLFITASNSTASFMLRFAIASPGNITVICGREQEVKPEAKTNEGSREKSGKIVTLPTEDKEIGSEAPDKILGPTAVAGELIAGIVLILLATLVLVVVLLLWGRKHHEQNRKKKRKRRGGVAHGDRSPLEMQSNYEEMDETATGYYRYSDPLDQRITLMNSSQLAIDKSHLILHNPDLASASAPPRALKSNGDPVGPKASAVPTTPHGTSRHLAELAMSCPVRDEDCASAVYEECSSVMLNDEEEEREEKHQREDALEKFMNRQRSVEEQHQPDSGARLKRPVIVRLHRKVSECKRPPQLELFEFTDAPDQSVLDDTSVYMNHDDVQTECDPSLSDTLARYSGDGIEQVNSRDKALEGGAHINQCNHLSQAPTRSDSPIYFNTRRNHNSIIAETVGLRGYVPMSPPPKDTADNVHDIDKSTPAVVMPNVGSTPIEQGPEVPCIILNEESVSANNSNLQEELVTGVDSDMEIYGPASATPWGQEHSTPIVDLNLETYGLTSAKQMGNKLSRETAGGDLRQNGLASVKPLGHGQSDEPGLETYGMASAKPLRHRFSDASIEPGLETYGVASAKPLGHRFSDVSIEPDLETYGVASAKPLGHGLSDAPNEPDLETYGMASAKRLARGQSDATLGLPETYGLISAKPLGHDKSGALIDADLETYGVASAKPLGNEKSGALIDADLQTYGVASAKPLGQGQVTPTTKLDLETYGLASAMPIDHCKTTSHLSDFTHTSPHDRLNQTGSKSTVELLTTDVERLGSNSTGANQHDTPNNEDNLRTATNEGALLRTASPPARSSDQDPRTESCIYDDGLSVQNMKISTVPVPAPRTTLPRQMVANSATSSDQIHPTQVGGSLDDTSHHTPGSCGPIHRANCPPIGSTTGAPQVADNTSIPTALGTTGYVPTDQGLSSSPQPRCCTPTYETIDENYTASLAPSDFDDEDAAPKSGVSAVPTGMTQNQVDDGDDGEEKKEEDEGTTDCDHVYESYSEIAKESGGNESGWEKSGLGSTNTTPVDSDIEQPGSVLSRQQYAESGDSQGPFNVYSEVAGV